MRNWRKKRNPIFGLVAGARAASIHSGWSHLTIICHGCMPSSTQGSMSLPSIRTATVPAQAPELAAIRELWRQDSATLGFFPQGAFANYAEEGGIISATDTQGQLLGYLAFRRARHQAVIVHLRRGAGRAIGLARPSSEPFRMQRPTWGARVTCRKGLRCRRSFGNWASSVCPNIPRGRRGRLTVVAGLRPSKSFPTALAGPSRDTRCQRLLRPSGRPAERTRVARASR